MIREKAFFWIGLLLGLTALMLLFASPAGRFWWFPFVLSGSFTAPRKSEHESTEDVSSIALTVAFFAVAVLFALLLLPDAVWTSFHLRVPDWAYGQAHEPEAMPMWWRIGLAALWSVVTWRRFRQLEVQHGERRLVRSSMTTRMVVVLFLGLLGTLSGCAARKPLQSPQVAVLETTDCSDLPQPAVELTDRERCWVASLTARCGVRDRCIAECLLLGQGRANAGGCFHNCANFTTLAGSSTPPVPPWSDPPGWEKCRGEKERTPVE